MLPVIAGLAGAPGLAAFVCIAGAMAAGIASLEFELVAEELALERWWAITLAAAAAVLAVRSMVPWPYVVERLYTGEAGPPRPRFPEPTPRQMSAWAGSAG